MFARLTICVLVAASSVIATTIHRRHPGQASSSGACSTGSVQCCEGTAAADSPSGSAVLALLGMSQQGVTGLLGFNCNPMNFGGASDPTCQQTPVCCEDNDVGGFFSMGCAPMFL